MKALITLAFVIGASLPAIAQSTWTGSINGTYGTVGNWSPSGVPSSSTDTIFQTSPNTAISLGDNRTVRSVLFTADANAFTFNGFRLSAATAEGIRSEYGLITNQTFNSDIGAVGTQINLINNSLSGSLFVLNSNFTNGDNTARFGALSGVGGGVISGNIVNGSAANFGLRSVGGGGTWVFRGTNTSTLGGTSANNLLLANGATLELDFAASNAVKLTTGQQLRFAGGNLRILGNATASTTISPNSTVLSASNSVDSLFGFGSVLDIQQAGNPVTVNLGAISRDTTGTGAYLRITGNGTTTTTSANGTGNVLSGVVIGNDFATKGGSDTIVPFTAYTALPASGTGSSSTVYSATGTHTINSTAVFNAIGIKLDTSAAGQSLTLNGTGTTNLLSTTNALLLFVGNHDYTITATTFGRADAGTARTQTLLNTGLGTLTMNAAINTIVGNTAVMQFGGPGTTVLTLAASGTAGSVRIAEGIVALTNGNAFGDATPSVGVQSGGTLELRNNITLAAANTLNLHGLGNGGNGALRSNGGANTVSGNLVLGITSRIKTETGSSLTISGNITGTSAEFPTLILAGGGNTTVSGQIQAGITGGLVKEGSGIANLTRADGNPYSGTTWVNAGTLLINNTSGSGTGSGSVRVASGAVLGGNGTASGAVSINGSLAPGNSIGVINTGNLSIGTTGSLDIELGRDGVTPVSDRANVTGSVTLLSGANLELTLYTGLSTPAIGDVFFLVSNDSSDAVAGVFTELNGVATTLNEGSNFTWNSQQWTITYLADFGSSSFTGGNDIALQVIPEPSTWMLMGVGASLLFLARRRRSG